MLARLRDGALELLSPTRCAACERPGVLLCDACLHKMQLIDPATSCVRCGAPFGDVLCTECRGAAAPCDRVLATAVFEDVTARIVRAYKDAGEQRLSRLIAEMLFDTALHAEWAAPTRYGGLLDADAVTFVPATAEAYRRRGFDHMELVARAFCGLAGLPLADVLVKHGHADQRAAGRAGRFSQARGAYEAAAPLRFSRLLVLDDVITTGATLAAVAGTLREAGATRVDALALARVWGASS